MKHLFLLICTLVLWLKPADAAIVRTPQEGEIPSKAIFYDSKWKRIGSSRYASFYRILGKNKAGVKFFRDYYISGQLKSEKHYITLGATDDRQTVLTGLCRTFYKSGKPESIMQYVNGKAHGRAVSFFPSGRVGMKLNYRNGVLHGASYAYNEQGKLEYTTMWNGGKMVSERQGGHDSYIDKATGVDMFIAKYTSDVGLIEAKAHDVATQKSVKSSASPKHSMPKGGEQKNDLQAERQAIKEQDMASEPVNQSDELPDTQELIAEIRYPDGESTLAKTPKTTGKTTKEGFLAMLQSVYKKDVDKEFSLPYLYKVVSDAAFQTNEVSFYDNIAMTYGLNIAQSVPGLAGQKELIYHYNMDYDEVASADRVTGSNPRQIAFWGPSSGKKLTARRISLFTWSRAEMLNVAINAIKMGFKVLGGYDKAKLDGNFILEADAESLNSQVVISFVHKPNLYAGLYHIQIESR